MLSSAEVYFFNTNQSLLIRPMSMALMGMAGAPIDTPVYIIGGTSCGPDGHTLQASIYIFDSSTDSARKPHACRKFRPTGAFQPQFKENFLDQASSDDGEEGLFLSLDRTTRLVASRGRHAAEARGQVHHVYRRAPPGLVHHGATICHAIA
ncbi:hypothetical protein V5799_021582 [Amblyomma americanum]|uniref:Uncharacterized protein n=1 Tax=Amblyomma americanum TaxID=6943 RepID=A0AAQ4FQ62_AMBAM